MFGLSYSAYLGRQAMRALSTHHATPAPHEAIVAPAHNPGIAIHSGSADYEPFRLFSVSSLLKAAEFRAWALGEQLRFKSLLGAWEGIQEPGFIVHEYDADRVAPWYADQVATLRIGAKYRDGREHGSRVAVTLFRGPDGTETEAPCGLFVDAPRDWALAQPNWTFDPTRGAFSLCIPAGTPLARAFTAPEFKAPAGTSKGLMSLEAKFNAYGELAGLVVPESAHTTENFRARLDVLGKLDAVLADAAFV